MDKDHHVHPQVTVLQQVAVEVLLEIDQAQVILQVIALHQEVEVILAVAQEVASVEEDKLIKNKKIIQNYLTVNYEKDNF